MCKQNSYSKYQKRVIKFLNELLGTEIPFSYEKTQTNHLKVLINGVGKPLFTGSTPSDCKSLNNFIAEVKRELRSVTSEVVQLEESIQPTLPTVVKQSHDKLINSCVKSLRTRISVLKSQEKAKILKAGTVGGLKALRTDTIKHSIKAALQSRKQGCYLTPNELKKLEEVVKNHLDFMMPTTAYYATLLESRNVSELEVKQKKVSNHNPKNNTKVVNLKEPASELAQNDDVLINPAAVLGSQGNNSAKDLMSMKQNDRILVLQTLSKEQSDELINDIYQAVECNQEREIEATVEMIREKQLPLDVLIKRLQSAA
ncbi:hypothetical protein [Vibrio sp. VB16]|uniref:hypothetical protein n=1 Tax=Vibrio sp. VB16 TaxID=2785746 RepID=UPI00189FB8D6|nr:hypothetical protein [Vibrio sp. VB16]UGA53709.1 hypothetical protein IUZ65_010430 [Vibrio sp. VB16]